ncbi:MAG: selenocysteine lyase, partial [Maribacter sp.]|nr:selenocysteine lyase [Maribacter sp.]
HPTMTTEEVDFICEAIEKVAANHTIWAKDYIQNNLKNEFEHKEGNLQEQQLANSWFKS